MKPNIKEWVDKAEGDWSTMTREFQVTENPNYDAVCFHAQQCAEKYLKAKLQDEGVVFRKIHDLEILLNDILPLEPNWNKLQNSCDTLTVYAVKYRYPGDSADKFEAKESVKHCRLIRNLVRESFGLPIN